jgi:hypothetical protein
MDRVEQNDDQVSADRHENRASADHHESLRPQLYLALRSAFAIVAALETGYLLAVVAGWTPLRAAIAAFALIVGATAASVVVFLLGRGVKLGLPAAMLLAAAVIAGPIGPAAAVRASDPTQTRPADLALSIACAPSADGKMVTVRVSYRWLRKDLLEHGLASPSGAGPDELMVAAVVVGSVPDHFLGAPGKSVAGPFEPELAQWAANFATAAANETPPPGFIANMGDPFTADWHPAIQDRGWPMATFAAVDPSARTGTEYSASGSFVAMYQATAPLPLIYVEFRHAHRFTVGSFGSCASASLTYGRVEQTLSDY